ncbi:unnamed protein product [Notodromas monacha]|uniref:Uncharacterized protein n=1 Tax=Notodromas monacha TaxID=399045 RepID=A0A7R9BQR9_9CRUS|nr:unnamed protein product [Notodromas monacha]CAG0918448.1 unnamed protein product [Notodromas monacha]
MQGVENYVGLFVGLSDPRAVFSDALDKKAFKAVNPWQNTMPQDLLSDFVTDMLNKEKNDPDSISINEDGTVTVSYNLMIVIAKPKPTDH